MEAAGREAAASSLLGVAEPDVATELDAEYAMATRDAWTQRHREMRSLAARLEVLEKKAAILPLGPGEKLDRIAWTAELEGAAAALPLAHGFAADPVNASNAEARFVLGRLLLATDDGAGLEHLDAAIRLDANLIVPASEMAFAFLNAAGRTVEAEKYHRNTMGSTKDGRNAAASRSRTGGYVAHGLSSTAVTGMNAAFGRQGGVRRAFLVRTATGFRRSGVVLNEQQLLLAIEPRRGQDSAAIIDALITEMDALESLVIVVLEGRFRRWLSAIRDTPDALLFDERAQAP
jgi:hypothetical protein